jgi:phosphatidate cytidylyltransferase
MLRYRLLSGCCLAAGFVAATFVLPSAGALALLLAVSALAQQEFYSMMKMAGIPVFRVLGTLCGSAVIAATFMVLQPGAGAAAAAYRWEHTVLLLGLMAVFVRQFPQRANPKPLETIACTLLGVLYVPYLFNYFTRLIFTWDVGSLTGRIGATGRALVLYVVVVVKCTDVGAYFVGRFLGRHKLFPRISPKKTWEGLVGGLALALVSSWLFCRLSGGRLGAIEVRGIHTVLLGLLLGAAGAIGDMFESLLKRACGLKDSGHSLPGFGGLLDLLDSLLLGAPFCYLYVRLVLS